MNPTLRTTLLFVLFVVPALAADEWDGDERAADEWAVRAGKGPDPKPQQGEPPPQSYSELTFGFMGGLRDESSTGFVVTGETAGTPGAASLVGPFVNAPLTRAIVSGPAWEARWVHHHVRMTVGLQKPFALLPLADGAGQYDVDGTSRSVSLRTLQLWDVRLGLGAELTVQRVTPFVDLLGDVRWVGADVAVDGLSASYRAWSFGYSVRAGLKVRLSEAMFVAASGEVGLLGASRYGGQLVIGFALPFD